MSSFLRQSEVDALFGVAPDAVEVQPYDFASPPRFPRERRAMLESTCQRFATALQNLLSSRLRRPLDITTTAIEPVSGSEFVHARSAPCAAFVFGSPEQPAVMDFGMGLGHYLIERLFGGSGEATELDRRLTTLEESAVRSVAERVAALARQTWRLPGPPAEVTAFHADPGALPLAGMEETVVAVALAVRSPEMVARFDLAIPLAALEPALGEAVVRPPAATARSFPAAHGLHQAHVSVAARLPLFRLSAREVAAMSPGSTFATGHAVDTPIEVLVNGRVRFRGGMGQLRGRLGLRIADVVPASLEGRPARDNEGRAL